MPGLSKPTPATLGAGGKSTKAAKDQEGPNIVHVAAAGPMTEHKRVTTTARGATDHENNNITHNEQ
jgi:hypothetical protein